MDERCTYSQVVAEYISRQPFVDFRYYDLVKPLEFWRPKLCVQNDDGSVWIGAQVSVITFEKIWLWPGRKTIKLAVR